MMIKPTSYRLSAAYLCLFIFFVISIIAFIVDLDNPIQLKSKYTKPGFQNYLLGSDSLGRSVLIGLFEGSKFVFFISLISSILASLIAILLSYLGAFLGDKTIKSNFLLVSIWCLFIVVQIYSLLYAYYYFAGLALCFMFIANYYLTKFTIHKFKSFYIPFDKLISNAIELFRSIPGLLFVILLLGIFRSNGIWNIILVIVALRWTSLTIYLRGEILRVKNENFVLASHGNGISNVKIFKNQIIPLIIDPLIVSLIYSIAGVILLEATLSFLGFGLSIETMTWGSMMSEARQYYKAWWLVLFPGLAILLVILSLNTIHGHFVSKKA